MGISLGGGNMSNFDFFLVYSLCFPILYSQYIICSEFEVTIGIMFLQI